ncbi:MAG TPA: hypothetical protein VK789_28185 [Bryobacteraceae bacterium]|jgi:hypothetical protein|nr:hypothetical protein [Bryobacteraceae bacterium]
MSGILGNKQQKQKDNSTGSLKEGLRSTAIKELGSTPPVIMETNGGYGHIYQHCYKDVVDGIVFEKMRPKALVLAQQRPSWSVYCCDNEMAIRAGVGRHLEVNFLDVDPYGECWKILDAFFASDRPRPPRLVVVVNCGLRQSLKLNAGWHIESLKEIVSTYGNQMIWKHYLSIAKELVQKKAAKPGYRLSRWNGYYCGHGQNMTHFAAVLDRSSSSSSSST